MTHEWKREDFVRRQYTAQSDRFDRARRIELHVIIDGKPYVQLQAREPGMLVFVSRPGEAGFDVEVVQAQPGPRYVDGFVPHGAKDLSIAPWQAQAMGFE